MLSIGMVILVLISPCLSDSRDSLLACKWMPTYNIQTFVLSASHHGRKAEESFNVTLRRTHEIENTAADGMLLAADGAMGDGSSRRR